MTEKQALVLLVDDEEDLCTLMQMTLARMGIKTHIAHSLQRARYFFTQYQYDACLTDLNMPDGNGLELVELVTRCYPNTPIAVLTAYGSMDIAVSALKAGAFDFVSKPINQKHLTQLLQKALNLPKSWCPAAEDRPENRLLIGRSEPIQQLRADLNKIVRSQAPVFITGESGSGKEVVARLIHQLSNRNQGPFIAINCGAIPAELMESELFGYKKGSFSGAAQDKQGLIQAANGGSLFLDEIAELPLNMQVKLLRVLQDKQVRPLGSDQEIDVDFRIISASHQNLTGLVQQGKFRQDLFFRLHVIDVVLPPLRERGQDILLLADHFIQQVCDEWDLPVKSLSKAAQQFLLQQHFPGNVRELRNMVERAIAFCDETELQVEDLQNSISPPLQPAAPQQESASATTVHVPGVLYGQLPAEGLEHYLERIEKELLLKALDMTHWNRTLAAKKLGMSFRSLRYRLKKLGLDSEVE